jgi:taurine dioxygenase
MPQQPTVTKLAGALGAEIRSVDLSNATAADAKVSGCCVVHASSVAPPLKLFHVLTSTMPDPLLAQLIADLLVEHSVLFFPDQHLKPQEHVALGRFFGPLEGHRNLSNNSEYPEMMELRASLGGVADQWHTDVTFAPNPPLMSILHMKTCPPVGGDTMWSNLCAAYDDLSDPMKAFLDGCTALHDGLPHGHPEQMAVHPVVRCHPVSGRKALFVNEHFTRRIVEVSADESKALLDYLTKFVQRPEFTVRYRWSAGTICMWDNRTTQHCVLQDFTGERVIQRVTVTGDAPRGPQPVQQWKSFPAQMAARFAKKGRSQPSLTVASGHLDRQLVEYIENNSASAKL